jgi:hypothetical protein
MLGRIKSKPFLIHSMNKFMFLRDMIAFVNTIFSRVIYDTDNDDDESERIIDDDEGTVNE